MLEVELVRGMVRVVQSVSDDARRPRMHANFGQQMGRLNILELRFCFEVRERNSKRGKHFKQVNDMGLCNGQAEFTSLKS